MGAKRFFVCGIYAPGDVVDLAADDARKLKLVLRAEAGDRLEIVDSSGRSYDASLEIVGTRLRAALETERSGPAPLRVRITLAQGIPKGQKMEYVVEKATELGVVRIVPFTSERSVAEAGRTGKLERWRRIAQSAAQQSGRSEPAEIAAPVTFSELTSRFGEYGRVVVPWELAVPVPLRERLPSLLEGVRDLCVVIGPEGGLSRDEVLRAEGAQAVLISLGSRILRTETAGLVICSAVSYASGDI